MPADVIEPLISVCDLRHTCGDVVVDRILTLDDGRMVETDVTFERMANELATIFAELPQVFAYFLDEAAPRARLSARADRDFSADRFLSHTSVSVASRRVIFPSPPGGRKALRRGARKRS